MKNTNVDHFMCLLLLRLFSEKKYIYLVCMLVNLKFSEFQFNNSEFWKMALFAALNDENKD